MSFRHDLAARNVLHDSLPMLIGRDCASPAIVGHNEIGNRRDRTGIIDRWALTYPEQVKIARLLTRPTFLRAASDPDVDEVERHALTAREGRENHPRPQRLRPVASDQPGMDSHHPLN